MRILLSEAAISLLTALLLGLLLLPLLLLDILLLQCGQGSTDDELSPTCVSSLLGIQIQGIAAGLWHTICTSAVGDVYAFGGNQFGQLGTGTEQAEVSTRNPDSFLR